MQELERRIKALSQAAELVIVVVVAFGWFIFVSAWSVVASITPGGALEQGPLFTEQTLAELLMLEVGLLFGLGWFLRVRGWTLEQIGLYPSWTLTAVGIGLALASHLAFVALLLVSSAIGLSVPGAQEEPGLVASGIRLSTILAVSILNPLYEELLVCGYLITTLKRTRGIWFAISASLAVRLAYHLYQGPVGVIATTADGLILGWWYARTGLLWPAVVAHAVVDLYSLLIAQ